MYKSFLPLVLILACSMLAAALLGPGSSQAVVQSHVDQSPIEPTATETATPEPTVTETATWTPEPTATETVTPEPIPTRPVTAIEPTATTEPTATVEPTATPPVMVDQSPVKPTLALPIAPTLSPGPDVSPLPPEWLPASPNVGFSPLESPKAGLLDSLVTAELWSSPLPWTAVGVVFFGMLSAGMLLLLLRQKGS